MRCFWMAFMDANEDAWDYLDKAKDECLEKFSDEDLKEAEDNEAARWHKDIQADGRRWEPWPHPCSTQPVPAAAMAHPRGPIGILLAEMIRLDVSMDSDLNIHRWR